MELSGLTRYVPVWHLTVLSLVSLFQVKLTGTFLDHEAPGHPIEATLSGLLCVRHSASHFVSTHTPLDPRAGALALAQEHGEELRQRWQNQLPPASARLAQHVASRARNLASGARGHAH